MKEVVNIKLLCFGAIASNIALLGVLFYNTSFSSNDDIIACVISSFGFIVSILYAVQLLLMKRNYYRHQPITSGARVFFHISRIIQLLYTLAEALLLGLSIFNSYKNLQYDRYRYQMMAVYALLLVTVVMNLTIFFRGWRLLRQTRTSYIDEVMATFDEGSAKR